MKRRISFSVEENAAGAKRRISFTAEERAALAAGADRLREEVRGWDEVAECSTNLKERRRAIALARTALANLTRAFDGLIAVDLIGAMDDGEQFLDLLPRVKKCVDAMTGDGWVGGDRKTIRKNQLRFITLEACTIVVEALDTEIKGPRALEAVRWVLAFAEDRSIDADSVRKRIDMILRARK
jgi:hypothetical protein